VKRLSAVRRLSAAALGMLLTVLPAAGCSSNRCCSPCVAPPAHSCTPTSVPCTCWPAYTPGGGAPSAAQLLGTGTYVYNNVTHNGVKRNAQLWKAACSGPNAAVCRANWDNVIAWADWCLTHGANNPTHTCQQQYAAAWNAQYWAEANDAYKCYTELDHDDP
jgi:hypothetical protein